MSRSEAIVTVGVCIAVGAACLATHSADPLWVLLLLAFWGI